MTYLLGIFSLLLFCSCSLAPFSNVSTAQSNGEGSLDVDFGAAASGVTYYGRVGYGVSKNLDLGATLEVGALSATGLWGKYSFINNKENFSAAVLAGAGSGNNTNFNYFGAVISYKFKKLEPYYVGRYNTVSLNDNNIELGDEFGDLVINALKLNYITNTFGINIWLNKKWALNLNSTLLSDAQITNSTTALLGVGFKYLMD
jgi:hypothetical protein